jgi:hypothetical protein
MPDDMPTKYCRRIEREVYAEMADDITSRVFLICKYYNSKVCIKDSTNRRCLVKLAVQRDEKGRLSSKVSS